MTSWEKVGPYPSYPVLGQHAFDPKSCPPPINMAKSWKYRVGVQNQQSHTVPYKFTSTWAPKLHTRVSRVLSVCKGLHHITSLYAMSQLVITVISAILNSQQFQVGMEEP